MKKIAKIFCLALTFVSLLSSSVLALTPLDPSAPASLTLFYGKDGEAFSGEKISLYRVAQANADGTFTLLAPFSSYPVSIYDITTEEAWQKTAKTFSAYLVADHISPTAQKETDGEGKALFASLETGLYLVGELMVEKGEGTYQFDPFFVYLPTFSNELNTYDYQVEAKPKASSFTPSASYTVTKLWQDEGHKEKRPDEVVIDIYIKGSLFETATLSSANHWTYQFTLPPGEQGVPTVVERKVSSYTVSISSHQGVFTLVNTYEDEEPDKEEEKPPVTTTKPPVTTTKPPVTTTGTPPATGEVPTPTTQSPSVPTTTGQSPLPPVTGDDFALIPWVLVMCFSGLMLVILGIYSRRRK